MKLPSVILVAMLWCVQVSAILPIGAQLTERQNSAVDVAFPRLSNQSIVGEEIRLKPDGVNTDPGWALDQIGEKFSANTTSPIYSYPDTTTPVRLYLIDTAVRNPSSFTDDNSNLKSFEVINLSGGPPVPRDHGTQMLSLIAGKGTGAATGTPIHVVNYDIYSDSSATDPTTDVTSLAEAISEAVEHSKLQSVPMRSVICIATSSSSSGQRDAIDKSIDSALAAGIPVVISAGNLGLDAAGFTPPSNGAKNGVICVGASYEDGQILSEATIKSNYGTPVDILAPGFQVDTRKEGGSLLHPIVPMTGTSPATALVAGAVLAKLSASPTFTPAGIESSLKSAAQAMSSGPPVLRSIVAPDPGFAPPDVAPDGPIAGATIPVPLGSAPSAPAPLAQGSSSTMAAPAPPAADSDSDGIPDIVETFHGTSQGTPPQSVVSLDANRQIHFKFPIDPNLLDSAISGNRFVLRNGYSWVIRCSSNFSDWSIPVGTLSKTTDAQGQAWLIASFPAGTQPSCFAQIQVIAPSAR
jgi:hypothetical protein